MRFRQALLRHSNRVIVPLAVLAALVIGGTAGIAAWVLREQAINDWKDRMSHESLILAEHAGQTMFSAHTVLNGLQDLVKAAHIENQAQWVAWASAPERHAELVERTRANPIIDVATYVAADGLGLNFTRSYPMRNAKGEPINLADRDYFKAHAQDPSIDTFTSVPVPNRGNGKWVFYITRRVNNSAGEMLGVILVGVSVEVFSKLYERVTSQVTGPGASISLYRSDFTLMTRWPLLDEMVGTRNLAGAAKTLVADEGRKDGVLLTNAPRVNDRGHPTPRMVAARVVEGYPLIVVPVVTEETYLAQWRQGMVWILGATGFCLLLVFGGARMLWRADVLVRAELAQRRRVQDELRSARDELNTAVDALPDVVVYKDGEGRWRVVNEQAQRFFGFSDREWLGRTDAELAAARPHLQALHQGFAAGDDRAWHTRSAQVTQISLRNAQERDAVLEVRRAPMFDASGAPQSLLVVARDITALELAMRQKRAAQKRSEEIRQRAIQAESAVVNISEATLRQIGQELHDDFGQILTGAAMLADTMAHNLADARPADAATAERLVALLNDAVRKTRSLSHGLYAAELEEGALAPMLASLAEHLESTTSLAVDFQASGDPFTLSREQALHLYRIVQEATSNAVRHSKATALTLEVDCGHGQLRVSVVDNGSGIPADKLERFHKGMGLQTMRHRATLIGGELEIKAGKSGGTEVSVRLRVKEGASA